MPSPEVDLSDSEVEKLIEINKVNKLYLAVKVQIIISPFILLNSLNQNLNQLLPVILRSWFIGVVQEAIAPDTMRTLTISDAIVTINYL